MPENVRGQLERGNADLQDREEVPNLKEGGTSTVRSMSFNDGKHEVLIPTATDGKIYSDEDAIARYRATGEHLGKFATPEAATAYAQQLHKSEEARIAKKPAALSLPVREIPEPTETPEQRTQRYLNRQSETETPDQRTQRYLEKARKAGYMTQSPMAPTGSDIASSLDKYRGNDEQDNRIRQGIHDTLNPEPAMEAAGKVAQYGKEHLSEGFRARLRGLAEGYVARVSPAASQAGQDREIEENARAIEIARKHTQPRDGGEIDDPGPVRQPVMQERGFSNDDEKQRYLEKVRQAMANAGKK